MAYALMVKDNKIYVLTDEIAEVAPLLVPGRGYNPQGVQRAGNVYMLPLIMQDVPPWVFVRDMLVLLKESDEVYYEYLRATNSWADAVEFGGSKLALLDTYIYEQGESVENIWNVENLLTPAKNEPSMLVDIPPEKCYAIVDSKYGKYCYLGIWNYAKDVQKEMEAAGAEKIWVSDNIALYCSDKLLADDTYTEDKFTVIIIVEVLGRAKYL